MGVGRQLPGAGDLQPTIDTNSLATPTPPHKGEGKTSYAASAFVGFSGAVIAPETLISPTSLSE